WRDLHSTVDERLAKIAMKKHPGQVVGVLGPQRLIEAVVVEDVLVLGAVEVLVEQSIAGQPVDAQEHGRRYSQDRENDQHQALADVDQRSASQHFINCPSNRKRAPGARTPSS